MNEPMITKPPMAAARKPTTAFRTGTWRFERPVFAERIAPCREACPVGIDIPVIMSLIEEGLFENAYHKILEENPFPGICGQICFHPCEKVCNRGRFDRAVSIRDLEKFISEQAPEAGFILEAPRLKSGKAVAVIGGGSAGLSCAYFLANLGHRVTIYEEGNRQSIFRLAQAEPGLNTARLEWEVGQVMSLGIDLHSETPMDAGLFEELAKEFNAVYVSAGVVGEEITPKGKDVHTSQELFHRIKAKNPPLLSGRVVIIGGGRRAMDTAWAAKGLGGQPLVVHSCPRDEVPTPAHELDRAEREGIAFEFQTSVFGLAEKSGRLKGLTCCHTEGSGAGVKNENATDPQTAIPFEIPANHVIIASDFKGSQGLRAPRIRESGLLVLNENREAASTSPAGGREELRGSRVVVREIALGKRAALILDMSLRQIPFHLIDRFAAGRLGALSLDAYQTGPADPGKGRRIDEVVRFRELNLAYFKKTPRIEPSLFGRGFTKRQALLSAKRCFKCGTCTFCRQCFDYCPDVSIEMDKGSRHRAIDYDHCKGCGICAQECPRGAIIWTKE